MISKCGCDLTTEEGRQAYVEKRKQERAERVKAQLEHNATKARHRRAYNKDHMKAFSRERYNRHRKRILQEKKDKYWADQEEALEQARRRYKKYSLTWKRGLLRKKYGISIEQKNELVAAQDHKCAICERDNPAAKDWHVDHDHNKHKGEPGFIRGILCHHCNTALGGFRDDPDILRKAIQYLEDAANTDRVTRQGNKHHPGATQWL